MNQRRIVVRHALLGFVLALGAPAGWLLWRTWRGEVALMTELGQEAALYGYLLVGTTVAFVGFGTLVGRRVARLGGVVSDLQAAAVVDPLTKLKNRKYFSERLAQELARSSRGGTPVALLVGDLDHFKAINDLHGHAVGDAVLQSVARLMNDSCRAADSACRVGGEEFAIILPETEPLEGALVAERIRNAIACSTVPAPSGAVHPTISLGLAVSSADLNDADKLFEAADRALYRAKLGGRNRVALDEAIDPISLLGALRKGPANADA